MFITVQDDNKENLIMMIIIMIMIIIIMIIMNVSVNITNKDNIHYNKIITCLMRQSLTNDSLAYLSSNMVSLL